MSDIKELRAMLEAGTPGEWRHVAQGPCCAVDAEHIDLFSSTDGTDTGDNVTCFTGMTEDAVLIVAAVNALPALLDRSDESDIAARDLCGCLSVESVDGRTLAQIVEAVIARVDELEQEREKMRAEVERLRILTEKLQPTSSGATDVGNCNQRDGGGCDEFIRGTPTTKTCDGDGHYECKECFHFARTTKGGRDE